MEENVAKSVLEITNRESAQVSGVISVSGFGEDYVAIETTLGRLIIEGEGMRIESLSKEDGVVYISGRIDNAGYSNVKARAGLFSRFSVK